MQRHVITRIILSIEPIYFKVNVQYIINMPSYENLLPIILTSAKSGQIQCFALVDAFL